jgi:hypothetical protein
MQNAYDRGNMELLTLEELSKKIKINKERRKSKRRE